MTAFNLYSEYYNLLYNDKNYSAEAAYVAKKLKKYAPAATTILDLGCGTGRHDFLLAKKGFAVTGVDVSEQMLAKAEVEKHASRISNVHFVKSDIRSFESRKKFDAVVSLFHVMSYQNTNKDVTDVLRTVTHQLKPGGIFMFDFWYGPAVLTDKPVVRVKRMENASIAVTRIAEPGMEYSKNVVTVNYDVFITDKKTQRVDEIQETHTMRYFFEPELAVLLEENNLTILEAEEWMTGAPLGGSSWNGVFVCRKKGQRGAR